MTGVYREVVESFMKRVPVKSKREKNLLNSIRRSYLYDPKCPKG